MTEGNRESDGEGGRETADYAQPMSSVQPRRSKLTADQLVTQSDAGFHNSEESIASQPNFYKSSRTGFSFAFSSLLLFSLLTCVETCLPSSNHRYSCPLSSPTVLDPFLSPFLPPSFLLGSVGIRVEVGRG